MQYFRFLRRLEQSLKQRFSDSGDDDDDKSTVTSPLLHSPKHTRPEIRKSSSIGKLQGAAYLPVRKSAKKGLPLLTAAADDQWTQMKISGSGYSD